MGTFWIARDATFVHADNEDSDQTAQMHRLIWVFIGLCQGLTTSQPLWVILCRLPEKGRKEIVEEMKERDREERRTGMKVKKQKK